MLTLNEANYNKIQNHKKIILLQSSSFCFIMFAHPCHKQLVPVPLLETLQSHGA